MILVNFLVALFSLRLSSDVLWVCHTLLNLRFSVILFNTYWGYSCLLIEVLVGVEERMAFIMLVFKYSVAVSMSAFVFSEIEAEVQRLKISLKSCQLVSWLWIRPLGGFSIIAEPTVAITGECRKRVQSMSWFGHICAIYFWLWRSRVNRGFC